MLLKKLAPSDGILGLPVVHHDVATLDVRRPPRNITGCGLWMILWWSLVLPPNSATLVEGPTISTRLVMVVDGNSGKALVLIVSLPCRCGCPGA
jgi:hypothetical protein